MPTHGSLISLKRALFFHVNLDFTLTHGNQGALCLQDTQQQHPKNIFLFTPSCFAGPVSCCDPAPAHRVFFFSIASIAVDFFEMAVSE